MQRGGDLSEKNIDNPNEQNDKEQKERIIKIALAIFLAIFLVALSVILLQEGTDREEVATYTTATVDASVKRLENPIDFDALREGNKDIYAWIKIDDTEVDYPIVQSKTSDSFYLRHKAEDKSWTPSGAIYTEMQNSKGFNDSVTVIYGHNGYAESMFTTLHKFEKKEFFDSHPYFYIYTPTKRLTYQVVSAFKYDNRHILNSFDFTNGNDIVEFFTTVKDPDSTVKNVREQLDERLTIESKVVVLSTCITNQKSSRYLVCGVLVNNEKTY